MTLLQKALRVVARCRTPEHYQHAVSWLQLAHRAASGQDRKAIAALIPQTLDELEVSKICPTIAQLKTRRSASAS